MDVDLAVIGGGSGGIAAARTGKRAGARTVLVQDGPIGGDCTFTGCVPSKTLIEAAGDGDDFVTAIGRVRAAVEQIAATEDAGVFRSAGIEVIEGRARFRGPGEVEVDGQRLRARRFVLATGVRPRVPDLPGLDRVPHLTSDSVFDLKERPNALVVVGGGPLGCELAQAFARLGTRVTLVQSADRLLPKEEPEASQTVLDVFRREGIDVRLGTRAARVDREGDGLRLVLADGDSVTGDTLLLATGRAPVTDGLDLEAAGVALDARGFIRTDRHLATSAEGIYAVGDITGRMPFTHAAYEMGRIAALNALGRFRWRRYDPTSTPCVTFTTPEVARVGMTEAQAAAHGGQVAYLPMTHVDRAIAAGQTDGFVKLIAGPRTVTRGLGGGRVLGATVVATRGGELIAEPALAMRAGMIAGRLAQSTHAYPTWSIAVQMAAAQLFLGGARPARAEGASRG